MGKKDKDFKFRVGESPRLSSEIWSVKVRKDDVYIMNKNGKDHKISLHASGICHSAITRETNKKRFHMTPQQRRGVEWTLDLRNDGFGDAFNLVVPNSQLSDLSAERQPSEKVFTIPCPLPSFAVVIKFIKTRADIKEVEFVSNQKIHLLHSVSLRSGDNLLVIYYYTTELNGLIDSAYDMIKSYAIKHRPPKPLTLSSGFVGVSDGENRQYHIPFVLKDLN